MQYVSNFKAIYKRNGSQIQEQYYEVKPDSGCWKVKETGRFTGHPASLGTCEFTIIPNRYKEIKIEFLHGDNKINTKVDIFRDGRCRITNNDSLLKYEPVTRNGRIILFEGPNPMFDYYNGMVVLGLSDNEKRRVSVNILDWVNANIVPLNYTYRREKNKLIVDKHQMLPESIFYLPQNEEDTLMYSSGSDECSFVEMKGVLQ
jgi:hypothetical protein